MTAPPLADATTRSAADAAEHAAREGDLDTALRTADAALRDRSDPDQQARAAEVLAAVLPHRGLLARSVELHRWLARRRPACAPEAAVALLGVGALDEATAAVDAPDDDAPCLAGAADALTARGVLASVTGDSSAALSLLSRAAAALAVCDRPDVRGDTPAALGALVALHRGEPELAGPLLDRALALDLGGPAHRRRHLLLRAWCALATGDGTAARTLRARAGETGSEVVEPRVVGTLRTRTSSSVTSCCAAPPPLTSHPGSTWRMRGSGAMEKCVLCARFMVAISGTSAGRT